MVKYKESWLPHLKNAVPKSAYGFATCMYIMSLEGWRRGLELTYKIKRKKSLFSGLSYTLSDGKKTHYFDGSRGDYSPTGAIRICSNKGLTNKYLKKANVSLPKGKSFTERETNEELIAYSNQLGYPLVLKPIYGGGGVGVVTNICNEDEMKKHINHLRNIKRKKSVIIEQFFVGDDYRINVLNGEVIGAFHRRTLNVVGDGKHSVQELLHLKNKDRKISPFLAKKSIKMDQSMKQYLRKKGLTPEYIPNSGEIVYLRNNGEFFGQRDSVDVTTELSENIKSIAISAVNAIPDLVYAGVDMLVNLEEDTGIVNEVNSKPQISNHVFPVEGSAIDIPRKIIDFYFPETKYADGELNTKFVYNFDKVIECFKSSAATELKIPSIPKGDVVERKYIFHGPLNAIKICEQIQRKARVLDLHGEIKKTDEYCIKVVGAMDKVSDFESFLKGKEKDKIISKLEQKKAIEPVNVGFVVKV